MRGLIKKVIRISRRPVELVYFERVGNNFAAIAREKQLKGWSRRKEGSFNRG